MRRERDMDMFSGVVDVGVLGNDRDELVRGAANVRDRVWGVRYRNSSASS